MDQVSPRRRAVALAAPLVALAIAAGTATATVTIARGLGELARAADVVVVARVAAVTSHWDASRQAPLTDVSLSVLEVIKGTPQRSLTVQLLGGPTPSGEILEVAGAPRFTAGEKVVLFIRGNGRELVPLVGMWQGALRVRRDPATGVETVTTADGGDVPGVAADALTAAPGGGQSAAPLTLPQLKDLVRRELANGD